MMSQKGPKGYSSDRLTRVVCFISITKGFVLWIRFAAAVSWKNDHFGNRAQEINFTVVHGINHMQSIQKVTIKYFTFCLPKRAFLCGKENVRVKPWLSVNPKRKQEEDPGNLPSRLRTKKMRV